MSVDWQPMPGQVVLVEADGVDGAVTALVASNGAAAGRATLDLGSAAASFPAKERLEVRASVFAVDGLYRIDGTLQRTGGAKRTTFELRVSAIERIQRRESARARVQLPVVFDDAVEGETVDVSAGGVRAWVPMRLVEGGTSSVVLHLPDGTIVAAEGDVLEAMEVDGRTEYRVAFSDVAPEDRRRLLHLVDLTDD